MTIDLNAIGGTLINMGLPGIIILAMAWFILEQRKELKLKEAKIDEIQEKRIAEGREGLTVANNATNVLEDVLKAVDALVSGKAA